MRHPVYAGTLSGGITIIGERLIARKVQYFEVRIGAGYGNDPSDSPGVAHLVEHLVLRRADDRSDHRATRTLEQLGARPSAITARDYTSFGLIVPEDQARTAISGLIEMIVHPEFSREAIEAESRIIAAERKIQLGDPTRLLVEAAENRLLTRVPTEAAEVLTPSQARRFWADQYRPANMTVFTSGPAESVHLGIASNAPQPCIQLKKERKSTRDASSAFRSLHLRHADPHRRQTHLLSCYTVPHRSPEQRAEANVLVALLGGGFSSVLVRKLRTERQLSYAPRAFYADYGTTGLIMTFATVSTPDEAEATRVMVDAPVDIASDSRLARRVDVAKAHLRAGTLVAFDDLPRRVSAMASSWERRGSFDPASVVRAIDGVRSEEVAVLAGSIASSTAEHATLDDANRGHR